jgi:hypothetical protein
MPHNPIIRQGKLGTSPPELGRTQRGVLDDGRGNYQELPQKLGAMERWNWRNHILTVVDCSWHTGRWNLSLAPADVSRAVEWECQCTYRVSDPPTYVQQRINDLDNRLKRALLADLRTVAARHRLPDHEAAAAALAQAIAEHDVWDGFGLEIDPDVKLVPRLSDADRKVIAEAAEIRKALRLPRSYVRLDELPTAIMPYTFDVTAHLLVRITDRDQFHSLSELEEAVDALWQGRVLRALERVSRRYTYNDLPQAGDAVDALLEDGNFDGNGIHLENISAKLRLGKVSAAAVGEYEKEDRANTLENKRHAHILSMAFRDRASFVAASMAKGEMNAREGLSYFDERELQRYQLPIEILEKLKRLDAVGPDEQSKAVILILSQIMSDSSEKSGPGDAGRVSLQDALRMLGGPSLTPPALTDGAAEEQ